MKDLAAERAVLASLCQYGLDVLLECNYLTPDHFTDSNQIHFECIKSALEDGQEVDLMMILSKAKELGVEQIVSTPDEVSYIRSLFNLPVIEKNVPHYYGKLLKLKLASDLRLMLAKSLEETEGVTGEESISEIMGIIERPFFDITSRMYDSENKTELIGDDIKEYIQYLRDNEGLAIGIQGPFPEYNKAIGGGHMRKCVDIIGARMKIGKSLIANQTALYVAMEQNIPVLYLDTEMDKRDQQIRILANIASVPLIEVKDGSFKVDPMYDNRMDEAAEVLETIPYHYINISNQSFENVLSIARKWIFQHVGFNDDGTTKDCLIIYDYFKMMGADANNSKNRPQHELLGIQITQLHNFTVKYDVPCLTFVQLNRDGITKKSTDVVAGSDEILRLCTSFTIFSEKSDVEQADDRAKGMNRPFNRKLDPIIARHGPCMEEEGDYINVLMEGQYARLKEGPTRNRLEKSIKDLNKGFDFDQQPADFADI